MRRIKEIGLLLLLAAVAANGQPIADITANGSNGPLTITTGDVLQVSISLEAGSAVGTNADWYLAANTPVGWYYFNADSGSWREGVAVSYQGALFNLPAVEVLNISGVPTGSYTFYFGVDTVMNGALNSEQLYYDLCIVAVAETNPVPVPYPTSIPWQMFHYNAQHTGQSPYNGPQTTNLHWRYTHSGIAEGTVPGSLSIDGSNTIYVNAASKLLALSSNGVLRWSADLAGIGATALSSDGTTVYVAGGTRLYAFTTAGTALWTYAGPTENIHGEPTVATNGTIYFGSWDTYVYALNPDGSLKWKYQTDGAIAPLASPTLSPDESTIYVGSGDPNKDVGGSLYALNSDGTLKWKKDNLDQMRVSGAVVGTNGRVYACAQGRVHCFSSEGAKLWESANNTAGSLAPSLSSNNILYVGTAQDGKVYALDAANGQTRWSYQTGANPDPQEPQYGVLATIVIGANGIIYAGAYDGAMHALNSDGSLLWKYQTGDNINENCPAIGADGTLYFSSADKYLYAVKD